MLHSYIAREWWLLNFVENPSMKNVIVIVLFRRWGWVGFASLYFMQFMMLIKGTEMIHTHFCFLTLRSEMQSELLTLVWNLFQWKMTFLWIHSLRKFVYLQVFSSQLSIQMILFNEAKDLSVLFNDASYTKQCDSAIDKIIHHSSFGKMASPFVVCGSYILSSSSVLIVSNL